MNKEKAKDRAILSVRDPRIFSLGIRSLYNDEIIPDVCHAIDGEMFHNSSVPLSANDYNRIRLLNGLMEGPEIVNRIPLECNLDLLNYIDFTKGCYVGQELTARTKFKVRRPLYFILHLFDPLVPDLNLSIIYQIISPSIFLMSIYHLF